jgi:hypothetical protein
MTYNNNNATTATNVNTNNNINSGTMTYNNNNVSTSNINQVNSGTMTNNNNNVNNTTSNNVNQNNNVSTSTATNVNTNNNINSGTMTYNNNNVNQTSSTNTNTNVNQNSSTATNVNQNIQSGSMTNTNINKSEITQRVIQPPPTAIAPAMMSVGTDLCVTGVSGGAQTQVLGMSFGATQRDMNCERLKLSKTLYDMGMKVAAVATMCQDRRVFDAMMQAGTPCPFEGKIGEQAKLAWAENPDKVPGYVKE